MSSVNFAIRRLGNEGTDGAGTISRRPFTAAEAVPFPVKIKIHEDPHLGAALRPDTPGPPGRTNASVPT